MPTVFTLSRLRARLLTSGIIALVEVVVLALLHGAVAVGFFDVGRLVEARVEGGPAVVIYQPPLLSPRWYTLDIRAVHRIDDPPHTTGPSSSPQAYRRPRICDLGCRGYRFLSRSWCEP